MIPFFYIMKVQLGHISLNYKEIIPDQISSKDTVILFLHEALGSIGQWKEFPERLCNTLQLSGIVYERQGHGESSGFSSQRDHYYLHDYGLKELPEFIKTVLNDRRFILVGHSDGGSIALLYAHANPKNISAIVTMAAHVINEPETIAGIDPAVEAYTLGKLDGLRKYHGDKTDALFFAWADTWRSQAFKNWNIENEIGSSSIPGLFIQGADDQYGTPEQLNRIQRKFSSNSSTVLIADCGHHPHLEKTDKVITLISEWISNSVSIS